MYGALDPNIALLAGFAAISPGILLGDPCGAPVIGGGNSRALGTSWAHGPAPLTPISNPFVREDHPTKGTVEWGGFSFGLGCQVALRDEALVADLHVVEAVVVGHRAGRTREGHPPALEVEVGDVSLDDVDAVHGHDDRVALGLDQDLVPLGILDCGDRGPQVVNAWVTVEGDGHVVLGGGIGDERLGVVPGVELDVERIDLEAGGVKDPTYTAGDFRTAFLLLPITMLVAFMLSLFLREPTSSR